MHIIERTAHIIRSSAHLSTQVDRKVGNFTSTSSSSHPPTPKIAIVDEDTQTFPTPQGKELVRIDLLADF